jgi:hypothetical protein
MHVTWGKKGERPYRESALQFAVVERKERWHRLLRTRYKGDEESVDEIEGHPDANGVVVRHVSTKVTYTNARLGRRVVQFVDVDLRELDIRVLGTTTTLASLIDCPACAYTETNTSLT